MTNKRDSRFQATKEPTSVEQSANTRGASPKPALRPTAVCVANPHPSTPAPLAEARYTAAGALGDEAGPQFEPHGEAEAVTLAAAVVVGVSESAISSASAGRPDEIASASSTNGSAGAAGEPQPELELRVRAIYAVDAGAAPAWTIDQIRAAVSALVGGGQSRSRRDRVSLRLLPPP